VVEDYLAGAEHIYHKKQDKLIWLTCQIRKCSITVARSCWSVVLILCAESRAPTCESAAPGRVEKCRAPTISGVTRGLSQGGGSEGGLLAIVWACNN